MNGYSQRWKVDVETPTHKTARELNYIEHALTYMPLIEVHKIMEKANKRGKIMNCGCGCVCEWFDSYVREEGSARKAFKFTMMKSQ